MHNIVQPAPNGLPSARQLLRSTLLALIAASAILLTIVLPAEYAIDPTGAGRALGLTQMGEIKMQLAAEAAADAARDAEYATERTTKRTAARSVAASSSQPAADTGWRDETRVVIAAGRGTEVKLVMRAGEVAHYRWEAAGGLVNFDLHAHGDDGETISFEKGRAVASHTGVIDAAFDGEHGWFWRNLGEADVTLILHTRGQYADILHIAM